MSTLVGIEIECEGADNVIKHPQWAVTHDGSLQNGLEYVLAKPLAGDTLSKAVHDLCGKFTTEKFSQRCSTHIHIDVRGMSHVQRFNFITLYVMFEKVILSLVNEDRVGNLFCIPVFDSVATEEVLGQLASNELSFEGLSLEEWKYAGMNLASVNKLGSLEFRSLHGTRNPEEILNWVDVHVKLKEYAMTEGLTPSKIILDSSISGHLGLFKKVLGDTAEQFKGFGIQRDIESGVSVAQYFAFTGDWE